jgi:hypothetical protein
MEGWQRTFTDKSSRRRRRARRHRYVSRVMLVLGLSGLMLLALWLIDNAVNR